jgi:hypothetical protein
MKKTIKYIVIAVVVAAALVGTLVVLKVTSNDSDTSSSSSAASSAADISLISRQESDLESFEVKNQYSDFTVKSKAVESSDTSDSSDSSSSGTTYSYSIVGLEKYTLKESTLSTAAQDTYNLTSSKEIGEVSTPEDYGFGQSTEIDVSIKYRDGSTDSYKVGNAAASSSSKYYVMYNDKVYLCSINSLFTTSVETEISPASWSIATAADESSTTTTDLTSGSTVTEDILSTYYMKKSDGETIQLDYDAAQKTYMLSSPVNIMAPDYYISTVVTAIEKLTATKVVKYDATDSDLDGYGLKTPYAEMHFTLNGESHSVVVGNSDGNGSRYITVDGDTKLVYLCTESDYLTWMDITSSQIRGGLVFMQNIQKLSSLDITIDGVESKIVFSRSESSDSTESSKSYSYTVTVNGDAKTYSGVTTTFYSQLISTALLNMDQLTYSGTPRVKAVYSYYDGSADDTLEFYKADTETDRYVAMFNGQYAGTVRGTNMDELSTAYTKFLADDSINSSSSSSSSDTTSAEETSVS